MANKKKEMRKSIGIGLIVVGVILLLATAFQGGFFGQVFGFDDFVKTKMTKDMFDHPEYVELQDGGYRAVLVVPDDYRKSENDVHFTETFNDADIKFDVSLRGGYYGSRIFSNADAYFMQTADKLQGKKYLGTNVVYTIFRSDLDSKNYEIYKDAQKESEGISSESPITMGRFPRSRDEDNLDPQLRNPPSVTITINELKIRPRLSCEFGDGTKNMLVAQDFEAGDVVKAYGDDATFTYSATGWCLEQPVRTISGNGIDTSIEKTLALKKGGEFVVQDGEFVTAYYLTDADFLGVTCSSDEEYSVTDKECRKSAGFRREVGCEEGKLVTEEDGTTFCEVIVEQTINQETQPVEIKYDANTQPTQSGSSISFWVVGGIILAIVGLAIVFFK